MQKINIIFGGSPELYINYFKIFREIEKKFDCAIRKTGDFRFAAMINGFSIEFMFCKNPTRDKLYTKYQSHLRNELKELLPPPADEVMKRCTKASKILFLGLCGGLHGKRGDIHTPEKFKKLFFKRNLIKDSDILDMRLAKRLQVRNFLNKNINGEKSVVITSNLAMMPEYVENGAEGLVALTKKLLIFGDVVDKECYEIARFSKKRIVGIVLMTSDLIYRKEYMLKNGKLFNPSIKNFNRACIDSIKIALTE